MVITVQCPECSTSFPVDPAKVPPGGVKVRCSICATVFRVEEPAEGVAAAPATPPAPLPPPAPVAPEPDVEEEPWAEPEPTWVAPAPGGPEAVEAPEAREPEEAHESRAEETDVTAEVEVAEAAETPGTPEPLGDWAFGGDEAQDVPEGPEVPQAPEAGEGTDVAVEVEPPEVPEAPRAWEPEEISEPSAAETNIAAEAETPAAVEPPESLDEWVFETEEEIDAGSLEIEPVGTVEESLEEAREGSSPFGGSLETGTDFMDTVTLPAEETPLEVEPPAEPAAAAEPEPPVAAPSAAPQEPPAPQSLGGFTFGKRDPHDKARRLARVLVSDIITYNPDRHQRALAGGTLKEDFEDEIEKSWREYVDQVGEEIASGTDYWTEALNDVLAQGQNVF
jgi:predicted Zn finger-like uncharacterized protein